ncbi:FecR family protein [Pedobacter africanus]|uniref:FecR family protein n=2 Tax=Pedobacter africanus TaxID=151894 RepID=A0A1W2A3G2_9SPHI|nr:FecR family protein [Pedobacter africanus]
MGTDMENSNEYLDQLIDKYFSGTATLEERSLLERAYSDAAIKSHFDEGKDEHSDRLDGLLSTNYEELILRIRSGKAKRISLWPRIVAAAAAVAVIVIGLIFFKALRYPDALSGSQIVKNDILPGKNTATLTLANGKSIVLSDAKSGVLVDDDKLSYNDGTALLQHDRSLHAGERSMTLSTPRGGTYQITLTDGTKVWLNAASSLTYTARLTRGGQRRVTLNGEAYFEVAKDKSRPFVVESNGQEIEVLGTHFNVNSYKDEPGITTTLLEGSVKIKAGSKHKIIKPGEQAINNSGVIAVRQTDVDNVVDWKNGDFYLNHIEFKTAMRKIARWYDMDIIYDESVPDNMESGGWISRDKPLSAVLKSIESSGLVKFRVEGRKIYVMR